MQTAVLLLGSNLGDRKRNLNTAVVKLESRTGKILRASSIYETAPWGMKSDLQFFNQCISLSTSLSPISLLDHIQTVELEMGRKQGRGKYFDRVIDIDILFFGELEIDEEGLIIPHPRIRERKFALIPLLEIYPDFQYPTTHEKLQHILNSCEDPLHVRKIP